MTKLQRPATESDKNLSTGTAPSSTSRTKGYRQRQSSNGELRWEISISQKVQEEVRQIAKDVKMTAGVAAGTLLALGIETYRTKNSLPVDASMKLEHSIEVTGRASEIIKTPVSDLQLHQDANQLQHSADTAQAQGRPHELSPSDSSETLQQAVENGDAKTNIEVPESPTQRTSLIDIFKERKLGHRNWNR